MPEKKPALAVFYDPEKQTVELHRDPEQVKNWDFVLSLLAAAGRSAEIMNKMALAEHMQRQQQEAVAVQQLRRNLGR